MGDCSNSIPSPTDHANSTTYRKRKRSNSRDLGWPSWAECVGCCTKNTFGGKLEIWREFYKSRDFMILPCAHVVCSIHCLRRCRRQGGGNGEQGNIREDEKSRCTKCDGEFVEAEILKSKTIRPLEVTGRIAPPTVRLNKSCQTCIRPNALAEKYCQDCSLVLCQRCINHHSVRNDTARHSLITSPHVFYTVPKSEVCRRHPIYRGATFCNTCDLQFCQMCISEGQHDQHETCNFKELAQKKVKELEDLSLEHSKMANGMKTAQENLKRKLETLTGHFNKIQADASSELKRATALISEQQMVLKEDIVLAVIVQAYRMNLKNTCYNSLISQCQVFCLFENIFDLVTLSKKKNKLELMHKFYSLMKEQVKYAETTMRKIQEEPVEEIRLEDNTKATLEALEKLCRLELSTSSPIQSEEMESQDVQFVGKVLESSTPEGAAGKTLLPEEVGGRNSTVSDSTESDQDDHLKRSAFFCDDSSDDDKIIKTEPMDYDDRDEEPPDEDSQCDTPVVVIKKEIDYDMDMLQGYDSTNNDITLIPFQNGIPVTALLVKMLSAKEPSGEQHEKSRKQENSATSSPNVFTIQNETMTSTQLGKGKVSNDAKFDDEFIQSDVSSPLSETADSEDEFFKDVNSELANASEQDKFEPGEVLDPQTGLLIR